MRIIRAPEVLLTVGNIPPRTFFEVKGALGLIYSKAEPLKTFMPELKKEITHNAFEHTRGQICTLADDLPVIVFPNADVVLAGVGVVQEAKPNEQPPAHQQVVAQL